MLCDAIDAKLNAHAMLLFPEDAEDKLTRSLSGYDHKDRDTKAKQEPGGKHR
jgi:hypothetical protein